MKSGSAPGNCSPVSHRSDNLFCKLGRRKLPFKILALPVILLLGVFWVLGKIMTNLSAFVVGIFMLFIFLVGVFCAFQGQWGNVAFLIGVEVACLVLQYGAMMIVDISGSIKGALMRFLHS